MTGGHDRQPEAPRPQPFVSALRPYLPGTPIEEVVRRHDLDPSAIIKLASNENPLGMSPAARLAAATALTKSHRYPDQHSLVQTIAHHHGLQPENIVLGNGSVDILNMVAGTFLHQGASAVSSEYGFAIYRLVTAAAAAENIIVPASPEYGHDLDAMRAAVRRDTKIIWIANPNNPTGTFIPYRHVGQWLRTVPSDIVVLLDEAYYDYLPVSQRIDAVPWLERHPNLILLRTFSKIHGMAGLRIGYGMTDPAVAEVLNRLRLPFNASVPSLAGAAAALGDSAFIKKSFDCNQKGRRQLLSGLEKLELRCLPSYGNFVTVRLERAADICQSLEAQGIIVRPLGSYAMPDWLRITIGTSAQNQAFLTALHKALG